MKKAIIEQLKPHVRNTEINLVFIGWAIRDLTNGDIRYKIFFLNGKQVSI